MQELTPINKDLLFKVFIFEFLAFFSRWNDVFYFVL